MIYIYDIILNFNNQRFEHFEWNNDDNLTHIKKIPIFKTSKKNLACISKGSFIKNTELLNLIKNKTEIVSNKKKIIEFSFLLACKEKVIAILLDKNGIVQKISSLLIDEEEEIIEMYSLYKYIPISIPNKEVIRFLTREEMKKMYYINKNIKKSDESKLSYIYFELTGREDYSLDKFKKIIKDNINCMHKYFLLTQNSE